MSIGSENQQDLDLDMCGISRSYSQTKLAKVKSSNKEQRNGFIDSTKREDLQTSVQLNDLNILGLKDYYSGSFDNIERQPKKTDDSPEQENDQFTTTLDQLGYKLNEVIGHYLTELTSQSRLSLDSFELQKSENLDEEQQQQIMDLELNAIRQRIYKQIVDKINLSVIQSVRSIQSSSQLLSQSNIVSQSQAFSKELISTQVSQISQKSPSKSLTLSLLDLQQQLHQSQQGKNTKIQEQNVYMDCEGTKEELQNKLKISLQLNYQQSQVNTTLREELQKHNYVDQVDELTSLQQENSKLREENQALKEALLSKTCEKCKESFKKI